MLGGLLLLARAARRAASRRRRRRTARRLERPSTVDLLADDLRREILDGELAAGARLRERELCEAYGVARHSLRAALRALAAEGLVRIEPHRGATVARLGPAEIRWLYELRAALELEAAHLALERHGGRLPESVHAALRALEAACAGPSPPGATSTPPTRRCTARSWRPPRARGSSPPTRR